jgi:hypothetical protein
MCGWRSERAAYGFIATALRLYLIAMVRFVFFGWLRHDNSVWD